MKPKVEMIDEKST